MRDTMGASVNGDDSRRRRAERILVLKALWPALLLVWVIVGVLAGAWLVPRGRVDIFAGLVAAFAVVLVVLIVRLYFARCPNCNEHLYLLRLTGTWSDRCQFCGVTLQEAAGR